MQKSSIFALPKTEKISDFGLKRSFYNIKIHRGVEQW